MKYLSFIRANEKVRDLPMPPAFNEAMGKCVDQWLKSGVVLQTGGLAPSKDGIRIRLAKGELTVIDGPFTESKEVIGGWAILQTETRAEAVRISTEFMELHRKHWPAFEGEAEMRPIEFSTF